MISDELKHKETTVKERVRAGYIIAQSCICALLREFAIIPGLVIHNPDKYTNFVINDASVMRY